MTCRDSEPLLMDSSALRAVMLPSTTVAFVSGAH